jgi:hypothetical protein
MKILIAGDSFAAKWDGDYPGWSDLLSKKYSVKNIAQSGIGEYKIMKQIIAENISDYDLVIVSHTSHYRVHTQNHPIKRIGQHENCDLIFSDLEGNFDKNNESLVTALNWFKYHYDEEYQKDIYKLMRNKINTINELVPYISLDHTDASNTFAIEDHHLDFSSYWKLNRGNVNHYTKEGNEYVFASIVDKIEEVTV